MELQSSTVLVTGATGNMGPYVTDSLVDSGANVIGTYVTETARDEIATRTEHADEVSYDQVNLTDQAPVEAFAETVADEHGSVDHIVGLAGGFPMGSVSDTDGDAFRSALNRHATTAFLTVKAFADHLDEHSGVVLFSSDRAIDPVGGTLAYDVGKGTVRALAESLEVSSLDAFRDVYVDTLGFEVQTTVSAASFVSAGGYHHHLGANMWHHRTGPASGRGLAWFEVLLPETQALDALRDRLTGSQASRTKPDVGPSEQDSQVGDF